MGFTFALQIYGILPTSAGKQNIIRTSFEARFRRESAFMKYFNCIMYIVAEFTKRRTDIAHGIAWDTMNGWLLVAPYHMGRAYNPVRRQWKYSFRAEDIRSYAENFKYLKTELVESQYLLFQENWQPPLNDTPLAQHLQPHRANLQKRRTRAAPPPLPPPFLT
jgi:hypothetical protein